MTDKDSDPRRSATPATVPDKAPDRRLYRDPFVGRGICAKARALSPQQRGPVTQGCPRCGAVQDPETPFDQRPCLLEGVALDILALEAEEEMDGVRAQLTGPLEF